MEGLHVYLQLTHIVVKQKTTQHCKAIILQFKQNLLFFYTLEPEYLKNVQ